MNNSNYDDMDKEVYENFSVRDCVNKGTIGKGILIKLIGLSIALLSYFAMKNELFDYPLTKDLTFNMVILSYIFIIPIHEILHYIPSKLFDYKPKLHLLHNSIDGLVKREHFAMIVLSPVIIISATLLLLSLSFPLYSPLFIFLLGTHLIACHHDLSSYFLTKKFTKNCLIGTIDSKEYRGYL